MPPLRVVLVVGDKEALFSLAYQLRCYERKRSSQLFQIPAISELLRQMAQGKIMLVKDGQFAVAQRGKPRKETHEPVQHAAVSYGDGHRSEDPAPAPLLPDGGLRGAGRRSGTSRPGDDDPALRAGGDRGRALGRDDRERHEKGETRGDG